MGMFAQVSLLLADSRSVLSAVCCAVLFMHCAGGKPVLPNPGAAVAKKVQTVMDAVSSVHCPTLCCSE
jgi:hypothetical protein